jgi:adenosylcobinamide hydrolase
MLACRSFQTRVALSAVYTLRLESDVFIVSFSAPVRALSWAVLNGGFCYADHIINHRVRGSDRAFCAQPRSWLRHAAIDLGLHGKIVAMATAVEMENLSQASMSGGGAEVTCFATVGCGNGLSAGDRASVTMEDPAQASLHTINMILTVQPGLSDEAMVEAIQVATEGRVRALYEAGIQSSASNLLATGTGTDCIAIVSRNSARKIYCGKHTKLGELIGLAAYTAVKRGLMRGASCKGSALKTNGKLKIEE